MKTILTSFVSDQSGAVDIDGFTGFIQMVGFAAAVYFMNSTFGGVFTAVFGLVYPH
jgi:hypothetical protein